MSIEILPARLANQIAAGEVVERPASVVKELVENSLDAGATRIQIDIERGGHKLIRIRDNGSGINKDELTLALSRHATSKLKSLDDLENICSLGFRGEALASISSVSRLTLSSKPKQQEAAWQAFAEGRDMAVQVKPTAHPDGTTIEVKDLFFNTPARRKFLRTEKTEFSHIDELIKRIALSRFDVAITLTHNGKVVRQYRPQVDPEQAIKRVAQVAGKSFAELGAHIQSGEPGLMLRGWVLPVGASNTVQYSYVNNRMMRDKLILHAIRQAFEEVAGQQEIPGFVIYIDIDPRQVDVNVHPAKHEVRFHQGRLVHDFILQAIKQVVMPEQQEVGLSHTDTIAHEPSVNHDVFDYPKSPLRQASSPSHHSDINTTDYRLATAKGSQNPATKVTSREPSKTSHQDVSAFYQGINEFQAAHFDNPIPQTYEQPQATMNLSLLHINNGECVFAHQGALFASHFKFLLTDEWHQHISEHGHLEGKSLLLPVRVNLTAQDSELLLKSESWFTLLGFEISIEKQFVMVKKLPSGLYLLDVSDAIERLIAACKKQFDDLAIWLSWLFNQLPERFFQSQLFTEFVIQQQNNPQTMQRLQQKAVKIELQDYLKQLEQGNLGE